VTVFSKTFGISTESLSSKAQIDTFGGGMSPAICEIEATAYGSINRARAITFSSQSSKSSMPSFARLMEPSKIRNATHGRQ